MKRKMRKFHYSGTKGVASFFAVLLLLHPVLLVPHSSRSSFFILFSYTELLDLTNYLNHYYLITLLSFIMIFLPMNNCFSLDAKRLKLPVCVPRWTLTVLRLQVGLVYFFAGLSKIKYDWLIRAEPMKIWLSTCENIPFIGKLLAMSFTSFKFGSTFIPG